MILMPVANLRRICILIILVLISLAVMPDISPHGEGSRLLEKCEREDRGSDEHETWWILTDVHLNQSSQPFMETKYTGELSNSIEDINDNVETHRAIVLGDLVYENKSDMRHFKNKMMEYENNWTYVLGNHDFDGETPVMEVNYFSEIVNGFRIIAISDEDPHSHDLVLEEEQERWLKNTLDKYPHIPTIMMSHQEHGVLGRIEVLDGWLGDALKNNRYNVISWICGHDHRPSISEDFGSFGYDRLIPGAISGWGPDNHSMTLTIRDDEHPSAIARFRDHENKVWIEVDGYEKFEYHMNELNITLEGEGSVVFDKGDISENQTIEYVTRNDEKVKLRAISDDDHKFVEWMIDEEEKVREKTLEISGDEKEIIARFEKESVKPQYMVFVLIPAALLSFLIWRKYKRE